MKICYSGGQVLRRAFLYLAILTVPLTGCTNPYLRGALVEGIVVDFAGEALPGVSVTMENGPYHDLTDGRGHYRVAYRPGKVTLDYAKTGYAPARLDLDLPEYSRYVSNPVELWRLPPEKGIYFLKEFRYRPTTATPVKRFTVFDEGVIYGTRSKIRLKTENPEPLIVSYRAARYDVRLTRLKLREVYLGPSKSAENLAEVWVADASFSARFEPIDQPANLLLRLVLSGPLTPGAYAVQWGALEGRSSVEEQIYLFEVVPPPADSADTEENVAPVEKQ